MKKLFRLFYSVWAMFAFASIFLILFPLLFIAVQRKEWHKMGFWLYKFWAWSFYAVIGMPARVVWRFEPPKGQNYVYCPNHTSYFDIPSMSLKMPGDFMFVGKSSLSKIPLFGYQFDKLNISVDRSSPTSAYKTFERAKEAVAGGMSLVMFPEGGTTDEPPFLKRFKDGPFRVAIEQQTPIVPVTIPYNWLILPAAYNGLLSWHSNLVIFHEPIDTKGMTLDDMEKLKQQTYDVIQAEMDKYFPKA